MLTVLASPSDTETGGDEFGPFIWVELKDDGFHCEIEGGESITFYYSDGRWYPRQFPLELDGDTLTTLSDGTEEPGKKRIYNGADLRHFGWTNLLITEIEPDEDEFREPVEIEEDQDDN